jgi:hypothetical protein
MNRATRAVVCGAVIAVVASSAYAQQRRRGRARSAAPAAAAVAVEATPRVMSIPVVEAYNMAQRMRVWLFTPPAGSTAWGLDGLGEGQRVWALLPSCRQPNPDDPRDPCPVGRVVIEVVSGTGEVRSTEPRSLTGSPDARRVQAFVVPSTVQQVRIKILRRDDGVRWQAAVDVPQLHNLQQPEGRARGTTGFEFELTRYPAN